MLPDGHEQHHDFILSEFISNVPISRAENKAKEFLDGQALHHSQYYNVQLLINKFAISEPITKYSPIPIPSYAENNSKDIYKRY